MLPSVRRLIGRGIEGLNFIYPQGFEPGSSTVTEIKLIHSAVSAKAFEHFFSGIAALKKFNYEYVGAHVAYDTVEYAPFEPVGIVDALQKHARESLEELDILEEKDEKTLEYEGRTIKSLQMFQSLRSV